MTSARTGRIVVAALVAGCLALPTGVSAQSGEPPAELDELDELWQEYPLQPPETEPITPPEQPETPTPARAATSGSSTRGVVVALGGIGLIALLLASSIVLVRARRNDARPAMEPDTTATLVARAYALAAEAAECDKYLQAQRSEGSTHVTDAVDHDRTAASETQRAPSGGSYADIGDRVAGVLSAAEAAADQIRDDARSLADELLGKARAEAEAIRSDLTTYEADTRAAVDSYASDRRREVDQEVQRKLAESETQARATRQAAEAMARQIEEDARLRGQALRDESSAVEERLKKAAAGLRRMTAEIEALLAPSNDETLTDALRPYSQRDATTAAPAVPVDDR